MPLYHGSQKIEDLYIGSTKISELYKGSTLVYTSTHYNPNQVIFESATPGTYNVTILDNANYEIYCIGGGGHGAGTFYSMAFYNAGGGSGAGFIGIIKLNRGSYSIKVGNIAEDSKFGDVIISRTGGNAPGWNTGGAGGILTVNSSVISSSLYTNGNSGQGGIANATAAGGASVWNGYGKGESYRNAVVWDNATSGYVKIVYKGR